MSYRKERKFRLTNYQAQKLKSNLYDMGLEVLYPKRQVNSIYYDTSKFDMFYESEEGIMPRKKIRFRWYNNDCNFTKEIKISSLEGRYKIVNKNHSFVDENQIKSTNLFEKTYGSLQPTLKVSYVREYFELDNMRFTIDSDIHYQNLRSLEQKIKEPEQVMELKIPHYLSDDYYQKIIPNPTTRFSKYCRGILLAYQKKRNFL